MKNQILLVSSSLECTDRTPIEAIAGFIKEELGMEVVYTDSLLAPSYSPVLDKTKQAEAGKVWYHHAGNAKDRANHFAVKDWSRIACVWNTKGIVGSAQTADALAELLSAQPEIAKQLIKHNIPIMGYSDFTHLINLFAAHNVPVIYGMNSSNYLTAAQGGVPYGDRKKQLEELKAVLTGQTQTLTFAGLKPLNAKAEKTGSIQGRVHGGYTDVIASTVGTKRGLDKIAPDSKDIILFFEGVYAGGENTIKKQLKHILTSDLWPKISAIVFGDILTMSNFEEKRKIETAELQKIANHYRLNGVPFFYGLPVGHTKDYTRILPMGTDAKLQNTGDGSFSLTVNTHNKQVAINNRLVTSRHAVFSANIPATDLQLEAVSDYAKKNIILGNMNIIGCDLLKERNFTGTSAQLDIKENTVLFLNIDAGKTPWATRAIIESLNSLKAAGILAKAAAIVIGKVVYPVNPILKDQDFQPFKDGFDNFLSNTFAEYGLKDMPILKTKDSILPLQRFRQTCGITLTLGEKPGLSGIGKNIAGDLSLAAGQLEGTLRAA